MNNIVIVSCVFPPEPIVSAKTSGNLASEFAKHGHHVTVITSFPNRPSGKILPGFKRTFYNSESSSKYYHLIRCFSFFSSASSLLSRWLENVSFGLTSSLVLAFSPKPDVIYANTWPIFAQGMISLVAQFKKVPLVLSVQDIYPESMVSQGRIRENGWICQILLGIDRRIAHGCRTIILISESFAQTYRGLRGIPLEKIKIIPNWIDSQSVHPTPKGNYRQNMGIHRNAFVLVYGGNIGMAAGVETVIRALDSIKLDREIVLIIAGSGSNMQACQEISINISRARVIFHTPWLESETSEVLGAADVLVLPTRGRQSLASVPSKMISYMLAARPVLAAVHPDSDIAEVIDNTGCGWVIPPDSPEQLAKKIEEILKYSTDHLDQMGRFGREFALKNFVSEICLPKVIDVILSAVKS